MDSMGTEARMMDIRIKASLGLPLTDKELMCLQIESAGFGCGGSAPPIVRPAILEVIEP